MRIEITNYIRAGYSGIYIVSNEEVRVEGELKSIAESLDYSLYAWSITEGLVNSHDGSVREAQSPIDVFELVEELSENTMILLRDFHQFFEESNPFLTRRIKESLRSGKNVGKVMVILGCRLQLPPEIEREFVVVEFALPGKDDLGAVMDSICESARLGLPEGVVRDHLIDSASGLTTNEAENAFALSIVESGVVSPEIVSREKAKEVKKNGMLEFWETCETLEKIGGLELLKEWLIQRKDAFSREAIEYGLPSPKGLLIIGIPGTGKSLTAKATASVFGRPLLKLDAGKLFGGIVGESERNLRSVIGTVEAIAPCILWIDEIEKGFSGSRSSGVSDGGTSARVFGTFISWMQDKTSPVFVVATANDVTQMPPELLRKGRFDELFFVDLPNEEERSAIWEIVIGKYGRMSVDYDMSRLAKATNGLTGSEVEQLFVDSLYDGFSRREEPSDLTVTMQLNETVPLSKLMSERIAALRKWAKGRTGPASRVESTAQRRKIVGID